jgi:integrase
MATRIASDMATAATAPKAPRKYKHLTDSIVSAIVDFNDNPAIRGTYWDAEVRGLRLRVGIRTLTWDFYRQQRQHGARSATVKKLGTWPGMNVATARQEALVTAGSLASGHPEPGKRAALKFETAFADYVAYLERKAAKTGKPARWAKLVKGYGKAFILPKWGNWPLADMARNSRAVTDWHREVTEDRGTYMANRACNIIHAMFKRAARDDMSLDVAHNPTRSVEYNHERPREKGLALADFPKWGEAWRALKNPVHQAYHMTALLTGARPGELARLRWQDVKPKQRVIVIRNAKAGSDITIPMSSAIARGLKLARDAAESGAELVFPKCSQIGQNHKDALPAQGNKLRHTFKTISIDAGVDDLISHLLMGHAPEGISQKYIVRLVLTSGVAMRQAQRRVSQRIEALLKT